MKLKHYPKYKESGVQWIGKVPEEWEIRKINSLSYVRRGASPRPIDDMKYFSEHGEYAWVRIEDVTASNKYLLQSYEKLSMLGKSYSVALEPGEIFISIAGSVGKPMITKIKCCIHDGFVYFQRLKLHPDYLYWIFIDGDAYKGLGKLGTQLNLNTETISAIMIPCPSKPEQIRISEFIDNKSLELDSLIAKDEQLIELLKEKRIALINQAVTKGLDTKAKMKDSGIEWIGKVPEDWNVKRIRFNCDVNPTGKRVVSDEKQKVSFIPMEKVSEKGVVDYECLTEYWNVSSGYTYFENNDVLIAKITPCFENGKGAIVNKLVNEFGFGTTEFHVLRSKDKIESAFVYYFTYSHLFRVIGEAFMQGAAGQKRVSTDFIKDFFMPTPSKSEQIQIALYLDKETTKIDITIEKIEKKIELLEEYKKSLIHHVVTGKIDVTVEA